MGITSITSGLMSQGRDIYRYSPWYTYCHVKACYEIFRGFNRFVQSSTAGLLSDYLTNWMIYTGFA